MMLFKGQPCDNDGPVFQAPWEAQAFGMVLALHEQGLFTWDEWAQALHGAIRIAQTDGDPDLGNTYYAHWLAALESIALSKGLFSGAEISNKKKQWYAAYLHTPHGQPVELSDGDHSHQ